MVDIDSSILSASIARALTDKLYDKRKLAALELEKEVRDHSKTSAGHERIEAILSVLGGQLYVQSHNFNNRKGGLIGLAAIAIGVGKDCERHVASLVKPVLPCFNDSDSRIRYYALESLYNIVKVARQYIMPYFNEVFIGLGKLIADPDQNIRGGISLFDSLLKDIVAENNTFSMSLFVPLLREHVYSQNPFSQQFVVGWLSMLNTVPDIDMVNYLPDFLDGLFIILSNSFNEICSPIQTLMKTFLSEITKAAATANFERMANIVIVHSMSNEEYVKSISIEWLLMFIELAGRRMIPYISGMLNSTLPCLSNDDSRMKKIRDNSWSVNNALMTLVSEQDDDLPGDSSSVKTTPSKSKSKSKCHLDIASIIEVLSRYLSHNGVSTQVKAFRWLLHLFVNTPNKTFRYIGELFPIFLKALSDKSDEVVLVNLEVIAEVSTNSVGRLLPPNDEVIESFLLTTEITRSLREIHPLNDYFTLSLYSILRLFSTDRQLLDTRSSFIIRQLCLLLKPDEVYLSFSRIIVLSSQDTRQVFHYKFLSSMVQILNTILMTTTELYELRHSLIQYKTKMSHDLYAELYRCWCYSPVSLVTLCLLTQHYQHASLLLSRFGDLEVTVDFLTEIDKLVQLIESPIFSYLRLQLLDLDPKSQSLVRCLYSLLMLLPQSDAFHMLQGRLNCIPDKRLSPSPSAASSSYKNEKMDKELLEYFSKAQELLARRRSESLQKEHDVTLHNA